MCFERFHWKRLIKYVFFACLAGVLALVVFVVIFFVRLHRSASPQVYSTSQADKTDTRVRNDIAEMIKAWFGVDIPSTAQDLYFAQYGVFIGYQQYAAFRLNDEQEVRTFFNTISIDIDKLKKGGSLSESPWTRYHFPQKWQEKYQDSNWQFSEGKDFLYGYVAHQDIEIIAYVPDEYRIYLFYDVGG